VQPTVYRIVVRGRLTGRLGSAFEGMDRDFSHGNTGLVGEVRDQSQLFGVLDTVRALGLELVSAVPDGRAAHAAAGRNLDETTPL
jgi:hypothetical protein